MTKYLLILTLVFASQLRAHELQGQFSRDGQTSDIPRSQIPFDSFKKTAEGRVYTLWIAPDGALVFYLSKPWDGVEFDINKPDPRFRIWIVDAEAELTLPKGFEDLSSDEKSKSKAAEELVGRVKISWKGDFDYTISLDVKGARGHTAFKGHLFGGEKNVAAK